MQQGAVELQHLAGFVDDAHHILDLHLAPFDGRLDHRTGRGGAEHAGEQAFGVGDPLAVGRQVGVEALPLAIGAALEALLRALLADEAAGEYQQVVDLNRQQAAVARLGAEIVVDEAAGLPVFGNPCTGEIGHPGEQQEIASQRQHHAAGQGVDLEADRRIEQALQAGQAVQRPTEAACHQGHDQGVEPDQRAEEHPGEHAAAVGLLPYQGAEHRRGQLADGGERDLANGRQAGVGTEQAVAHVGQQQDQHDAHPPRREHPVAEGLERPFGVLSAQ
ncbi:hypothetical protein D3C84_447480 [compost metagenome]